MTTELIKITAEDIPTGVFVYLEDEMRFFFVDDVDIEEDEVTLYHEQGIDKKTGLIEDSVTFAIDEQVPVLAKYHVTPATVNDVSLSDQKVKLLIDDYKRRLNKGSSQGKRALGVCG